MSGNTTELWVREPKPNSGHDPYHDLPYFEYRIASPADLVAAVAASGIGEIVDWCETHGDMSAGLYGFRIDAYTCWAFTQIDWSLYAEATECAFAAHVVVPLEADKEDTDG